MDISVVVRAREDGATPEETLGLARAADDLGYGELWVGEGPTWDAFVLAAASVSAVTGQKVGVALGTASVRVVEKLHGRSRRRPVTDLKDSAEAIRELIETPKAESWVDDPDAGFLRRLGPPSGPLTVAAFGDRAIQVAADYADRMLLDLVTPEQVAVLRSKLETAVGSGSPPKLAAWLPAAVDPTLERRRQVLQSIAGYLTIGGYKEMFLEAGFDEAVERAASGAEHGDLVEALPAEAVSAVGLVGSLAEVRDRVAAYSDAGLDEVALVPMTVGDPGGEQTLRALKALS